MMVTVTPSHLECVPDSDSHTFTVGMSLMVTVTPHPVGVSLVVTVTPHPVGVSLIQLPPLCAVSLETGGFCLYGSIIPARKKETSVPAPPGSVPSFVVLLWKRLVCLAAMSLSGKLGCWGGSGCF